MRKIVVSLLTAGFVAFLTILGGCTDDEIDSGNSGQPTIDGTLQLVDLPGFIGINLSQNKIEVTRAVSEVTPSLQDGYEHEYALSYPDPLKGEYFHYLLFYETAKEDGYPLIFPIDRDKAALETSTSNVTLTISKMFAKGDTGGELKGSQTMGEFSTIDQLAGYLQGMKPYVLLNFKLEDGDNQNYYYGSNGGKIEGSNTVEKLYKLKKSELEALQMLDYEVAGYATSDTEKTDGLFFIMSNSVYSQNSAKVIDGTFITTKIFPTEEKATSDPALTVYVERLASKITIGFDQQRMDAAKGDFDKDGRHKLNYITFDSQTGMPILGLTIQKVRMEGTGSDNGIHFDETGYDILTEPHSAQIVFLGYAVGNLETKSRLFKDLSGSYPSQTTNWWNSSYYHRSYWAKDLHYQLEEARSSNFTSVEGYPHQFRLALDSDTVSSAHMGASLRYPGYKEEEYIVGEGEDQTTYTAVKNIGEIDTTAVYSNIYLQYKSFNAMLKDYGKNKERVGDSKNRISIYTHENTYYDAAMLGGGNPWAWKWQRAPYAAATNLYLLAEIRTPERDEMVAKTVYLGQNNIFYVRKVNFLASKLTILNRVMLSGGNAGLQILDGQWDQHKPGERKTGSTTEDPHLDKIAWNEGSVLWFAKVQADEEGNPIYEVVKDKDGNPITDKDGHKSYKAVLDPNETKAITIDKKKNDNEVQYLDLIPAELSGGDGQMLIAPHQEYMGKLWKYYLAPYKDGSQNEMDEELAVEISYNHLVALIHKIIGPVDVYTDGKMYFNVPIPHRISSYGNGKDDNVASWTQLGSFSLVRNNWYDITVTEISKLGVPVADPNQPIIPVMDNRRSYINMGVELLNWHDVVEEDIPMW